MKAGDKCTVSKHYRHSDENKIMTILKVEEGPGYRSGIKVTVDGLLHTVDSGLINLIIKSKKKK